MITRAAVPLMKQGKWGRLIHISSSLVQDGKPHETAKLTSKAALHGFSRSLAVELAADADSIRTRAAASIFGKLSVASIAIGAAIFAVDYAIDMNSRMLQIRTILD